MNKLSQIKRTEILTALKKLSEPLALDDFDSMSSIGLDATDVYEFLNFFVQNALLLVQDESDIFDPKQLYDFEGALLQVEGGGMATETIHITTITKAFKEFDALKEDANFTLRTVRLNPSLLEFASDRLRADPEIINIALQKSGYALKFAAEHFRSDIKTALVASTHPHLSGFEFVSSELRDDKEFALKVVGKNRGNIQFVSNRLKDDFDVALSAVRPYGAALKFLSPRLMESDYLRYVAYTDPNETLVPLGTIPNKKEILDCPSLLILSDTKLREDRDFLLELVAIDGAIIQFASDRIKDDDYVVFAAEKNRKGAYIHASERLKNHYETVYSASEKHGNLDVSVVLNWKKFDNDGYFERDEYGQKDFIRLDGNIWISEGNGFNGDLGLYKPPLDVDIEDAWEANRAAGTSDLWAYIKIYCCPKNIVQGEDVNEYLAIVAIKSNTFYNRQNEVLHIFDLNEESTELNEFVYMSDNLQMNKISILEVWNRFYAILSRKFDAIELPTSLRN